MHAHPQVAGMLMYYTITCGKHAFGGCAAQIICNQRERTCFLDPLPAECDALAHALMAFNPEMRPTAQQTLK